METFLKWVRNRFTMIDLMHLADNDNETLKLLMFNDGPSRNEFIKFLLYKLLLDVDSEPDDSKKCDLEKVFVSFGLLDKEAAQQFLKGNLTMQLHISRWRSIIEVLIPTTTIAPPLPSFERLMPSIYESSNYFRSVVNKNYLPPELIQKLQVKQILNENSESIEGIVKEIVEIIQKPINPNKNKDNKIISNCEERSSNCTNLERLDLISVKKEIEEYIRISIKNKVHLSNCEQPIKMSPQEFDGLIKTQSLDQINLELKVESISKLINAQQDLQILANSLADQI